ncbi:MAG: Uma2 family endonuclease [Myxococcota bacterium]
MVASGILAEDEPLELIDGALIVVSPQGPVHANLIYAIRRALEAVVPHSVCVRSHSPVDAGEASLPEPDLAVIRGDWRQYFARHPRGDELLLAVEVAHTSQAIDRRKARIYAAAGVPVYWLVDVPARCIEVRSDPLPDGTYALTKLVGEAESLEVPGAEARLPASELLP